MKTRTVVRETMKTLTTIGRLCLTLAVLLGPCAASIADPKEQEAPLTARGEQLLATYTGMLDSLKAELIPALPAVDGKKKAAFVAAHAAVADVPPQPNPDGCKTLPRYAPSHKLYARGAGKRGGRGDCASFRSGSVPVGRQA